jgi:Uma2 family endonuclease
MGVDGIRPKNRNASATEDSATTLARIACLFSPIMADMSTAVQPHPISVDEFLERPERWDGNHEELIKGEIHVSPNNKPRHNLIVHAIQQRLQPLEKQGFVVLGEVACRVTDSSLPNTDVAVIRQDRWEANGLDNFLPESPALVVEVASPNQTRNLLIKAALYLEYGAEQVWIAYPQKRVVQVLTPDGSREAREGETVEFHGIVIPVAEIFPA